MRPEHYSPGVRRTLIIVGTTAAGKSDLAVDLALRLRERDDAAEIVSADSMQVFRTMDIGTGKLTPDERRGVPHHLLDIRDPDAPFNVDEWLTLAERAIADIRARAGTPIVVGGSMLYVKTLLEGMFEGPPADAALRAEFEAMPEAERRALLERIDPAAAARIHPNDLRRTIRALEVFRLTGRPISQWQQQWDAAPRGRPDAVLLGLDWSTDAINRRINARVRSMVERGFVDEARSLWARRSLGPQAREALGYKQLIDAFEGRVTIDDAIELTKVETRRFAKNQRTWLRRLRHTPGSLWVHADSTPPAQWASICINRFTAPAGASEPA